ncbi:MAG: hypothetical protein Q9227_002846 [Pyrenula ochraceoflavens]
MDPRQNTADAHLDSLLQSLRQYAPQQTPPIAVNSSNNYISNPAISTQNRSSTPTIPVSKPPTRPSEDASKITEWRAAQRYVTFSLATNEAATTRIRKIIKSQHEHERQWWAGREALVRKQGNRAEGSKQVADILKSVGGLTAELPDQKTPCSVNEHAAELRQHDLKIHKALTAMARAADGELRAMGVPFFAIRHDLVAQGSEEPNTKDKSGQTRINTEELKDLQKRMLHFLEDLFAG